MRALSENPFCSMKRIALALEQECQLWVSTRTVCRYIKRIVWTYKKAFRNVKCDHNPEELLAFSSAYTAAIGQSYDNVVCIDEAGFYVGDHARYGYAPRGKRLHVANSRPRKHTLLMAISRSGVVGYTIMDHNCKKPDFVDFIEKLPLRPGQALLMDNIPFHKSHDTMAAIARKGCSALFIPRYSPRFNAIEYVFSAVKREYRDACPPATIFCCAKKAASLAGMQAKSVPTERMLPLRGSDRSVGSDSACNRQQTARRAEPA